MAGHLILLLLAQSYSWLIRRSPQVGMLAASTNRAMGVKTCSKTLVGRGLDLLSSGSELKSHQCTRPCWGPRLPQSVRLLGRYPDQGSS